VWNDTCHRCSALQEGAGGKVVERLLPSCYLRRGAACGAGGGSRACGTGDGKGPGHAGSLHPPATEKMNFAARGRVSASLTQERGSLGQAGREELVWWALNERDRPFCRGCLLKAERKIKTYFVLNEE